MNEAGYLLDEGVSIDALDHAMVDMGFPVGPITLMDEVGLDVGGKVGQVIYDAFGDRLKPSVSLARVIADGRTGRKGGKGFYRYENGKKRGVDESVYALLPTGSARVEMAAAEMQQRCMLALLNEAARCLEDGVLRSPRDGDVGAVFGIGFPPFLGGPFRYIDHEGAASVVRQLEMLHQQFAPRPGSFVEAAHHDQCRGADRGEFLEQAGRTARFEVPVRHVLVLVEARERSLVAARDPQRAVREDPLRVAQVADHFFHAPLPGRIARHRPIVAA
jgi:3-hydroxyacyl-CoA dehydrogenase